MSVDIFVNFVESSDAHTHEIEWKDFIISNASATTLSVCECVWMRMLEKYPTAQMHRPDTVFVRLAKSRKYLSFVVALWQTIFLLLLNACVWIIIVIHVSTSEHLCKYMRRK